MSTEKKDIIYTSGEYFKDLDNSKEGPFGGQECLKGIGENEQLFKKEDGDRYDKMTKFPIFLYEDDEGKKHYCFSDEILQNLNKNQNIIALNEDKIPINFIKKLDEKECEIEKQYHNEFLENISYSPFKILIENIYKVKKNFINNNSYRIYLGSHNFVYNTNFDLIDITDMLSIFFLNSVQKEITLQKMLEQRINYKYGCLTKANLEDSKRKIDEEHEYAILIRKELVKLYEKVKGLIKNQNYIQRLLNTIYNLIYNENLNKEFQVIKYLEDKNIKKIEDFLKLKDKKIKNLQDFVKLNSQDFQNLKNRSVKNFRKLNLQDVKDLKNFVSEIKETNFQYSDINLIKLIEDLENEEREKKKEEERKEKEKKEEEERKEKEKKEEEERKEKERIQKLKEEEKMIIEQKLKEEEERKLKEEEERKLKKLKKVKQEEERKVKQEEERKIQQQKESMLEHFYKKYNVIGDFMENTLDSYMTYDYLSNLDSKELEINNLSFLYKVLLRLKYRLKKILNDYKYKNIKLETIDLEKIEEEQIHIRYILDNILSHNFIKNVEKIDKKTYQKIIEYKEKSLENINKYKGIVFIFDTKLFPNLGKNEINDAEYYVSKYISFHNKSLKLKGKALTEYKLSFLKTPLEQIEEYFNDFFKELFIKYLYLESQKYISILIKELNDYSTKKLNLVEDEEYQLTLLEISILLDQLFSPFLLSQNLFSLKKTEKTLEMNFKNYLKYIQDLRQSLSIKDTNESINFLDDIQDKLADYIYKDITKRDYNFSDINKTLKVYYGLYTKLKKDEHTYHPISHEVKMKLKEQIEKKIKETDPEKIDKSLFISYLTLTFMEYFFNQNKIEFTDYLSPYSRKILNDYQSYLNSNYLK